MGLLIVGGSVLASLLLIGVIDWLLPAGMLMKSSGLIGNLLAIVGTFYGVLLGLIVVDSLTRFEKTIDTVRAESNCLADGRTRHISHRPESLSRLLIRLSIQR
jgi:ABC-type lipoprotein release transport system permease subunit